MRLLISPFHDPFVNLAIENYFFRLWESQKTDITEEKNSQEHSELENILFLYSNEPCVVLGRFQNPWKELNWPSIRLRKHTVVRRQSGGGTVYHDLGNLNFSFVVGDRELKRDSNLDKIRNVFKRQWNVTLARSENHDLHFKKDDGQLYKVSGNAFKQGRVSSIHHGTLLIDASLSHLGDVLGGIPIKMETKAVDSNPQQVMNINQVDPEITVEKTLDKFRAEYDEMNVDFDEILAMDATQAYITKLKSSEWLLNETPKFVVFDEFNFDWGKVKVKLEVKGASIKLAHFSSNVVKTNWSTWERKLEGQKIYSKGSQRELAQAAAEIEDPELLEFINVFLGWLRMTWSL